MFLYGKSGVGKTAATRYLLDKLERAGDQYGVDITTRMINCDASDTSYRVRVELVNSFRSGDNKISERGHARAKVYDERWDEIDAYDGLVILVLDEIDHLQDDSILYQISRASGNGVLQELRVAIIRINMT